MGRTVLLTTLVDEGHAGSARELFDYALDHNLGLALDPRGRMCLTASAADRMRQQKHEREAAEAFERERAEAKQRREREEHEVAAAIILEKQRQLHDREQRLQQATGASLAEIEGELRRRAWMEPDVMHSLADRDAISSREYTLEDLERSWPASTAWTWPRERRRAGRRDRRVRTGSHGRGVSAAT